MLCQLHDPVAMHRCCGEAVVCFQRERFRMFARRTPKVSENCCASFMILWPCTGAAEQLPSASSVSTAEGNASLDAPKIGKPKKRVSWRAGSLDDVAQASSDRAGLATPEELAQLGQPEQFTWKVGVLFLLCRDRLSRQSGSGQHLIGAFERC